jgi:hypothetical protein
MYRASRFSLRLSSLPLEELLEQTGAVGVGGGPALVEEALEIVAGRR